MSDWKLIVIYPNQIKYDTGSATLIQMPHYSDFDGYAFWHPSKLVRKDKDFGGMFTFSYTDNFIFHLKKYGKGKYNYRDLISEKDINAQDMRLAFDKNLDIFDKDEEQPLVHTPEKLEPENADVDESLIDNG